jgi:hypothetical protein
MERPKSPYSIHSRPTTKANRRIYYALFRDEAGKGPPNAYDEEPITKEIAVRLWCRLY